MRFPRAFALSVISGALLAFSWPGVGHPILLLLAWVPFLVAEEAMGNEKKSGNKFRFFIISIAGMLVWNLGATWWVWNSTPEGSIAAFTLNSVFMALVLLLIHVVKRRVNKLAGIIAFISIWLCYEWFHHRWDLSWPWLALGNAFASAPDMIQWYEITGVPGGTVWALAVNFTVLELIRPLISATGKWNVRNLLPLAAIVCVPLSVSFLLRPSVIPSEGVRAVVIQPNFDPYKVKFNMGADDQMDLFLALAKKKMHPDTRFLLLPETAVSDGIYEDRYADSYSVSRLIDFAKQHPNLNIIAGASTWKHFETWETPPPTARKYGPDFYEAYNTALWIDSSGVRKAYHKSKLVPGVEQLPYPALFGSLKEIAIDLGGTSGALGTQDHRDVFADPRCGISAAPVICYESIYGAFLQEYFEKGANAIFILTNDGWWGDSPGYIQHLNYARLRAIEYRVPVIRCTNTGISCVINLSGEVNGKIPWWTEGVAEYSIQGGTSNTLYARFGDWVTRVGSILLLYPLFILFRPIFGRREKRNPAA